MRKLILLIVAGIVVCFPNRFLSQNKSTGKTDSLEKVIATLIGKGKADALVLLAGEYYQSDKTKGLERAKLALRISEEENYNDGKALAYLGIALFEKENGSFKKSFDKGFEYALKSKDPKVLSKAISIVTLLYEDKESEKIPLYLDRIKAVALTLNENALLAKTHREIAYYSYGIGDYATAIINFKLALSEYKKAKMESETAGMTMNIGVLYYKTSQLDSSLKFYQEARNYFRTHKDLRNEASAITNIAMTLEQMGKAPAALLLMEDAVKKYEVAKDSVLLAGAYEIMGTLSENRQDLSSAIKYAFKAAKIREMINDEEHLSLSYNNMSSIYYNMNNYERSEYYARKGIQLANKILNKEVLATCYSNLGMLSDKKGYYDSTLYFQKLALKLREEMGMEILMAENYYNIADHYFLLHDYKKAELNFEKAISLSEKNKDFEKLPKYLIGTSRCLVVNKKHREAIPLLLRAEKYLLESQRSEICELYDLLSVCYEKTDNFKQAYWYLNKSKTIKDSLSTIEKNRINAEMLEKYETNKREKEISILTKDKELKHLQNIQQQDRLNQQNRYLFIAFGALLLISFFAFFLFKSNREKKAANKVILAQKKEVELQKEIVTEKNNEIVDSIHYAKKIQDVLLVNESSIANYFRDHFILFKPKDIVSGDFYWATDVIQESSRNHDSLERFYLAVCDSTGHGVPGAFMSLLNMSFLNEAIKERNISEPDKILDYVRKRLIETVSKDGAQDGMDGVLLCFDAVTKKITYSAAYNAPVLIRNGAVLPSNADKMPVGKGVKNESFRLFEIDAQQNDMIYLITDGFADQFGGEKGKKLKHKNLVQLLADISQRDCQSQLASLNDYFTSWKGDLDQIDDVTIIGIRI